MVVFSFLRVVMVEWDISRHVEVLFDAVFCYFPITYRPPPDDPSEITAQDLKDRLRSCLASTPRFVYHLFPALLEKLDTTTTSSNVKKDVLQTVTECARSYSGLSVANYSTMLWEAVRFEILTTQDEDLTEDALRAVGAIAECLSSDESKASFRALERYLGLITAECNKQLQEPQAKQAKPVGQLLGAVAGASLSAFVEVVKAVLPPLLSAFQDATSIGKQRALLSVLNRLLDAAIKLYGAWGSLAPYPEQPSPLEPFKDDLFQILSRALMASGKDETSLRLVAIRGLLRLAELRESLTDDEIGMTVQYLDDVLLENDIQDEEELKNEAIAALAEVSRFRSRFILDITFPAFLATLPDQDRGASKRYLSSLEVLARLSVDDHIFEVLVRRLLHKLDVVLPNGSTAEYVSVILSTLLYVLSQRQLHKDQQLGAYYDKLVVGLFKRVVEPLQNDGSLTALNDESALHVIGKLAVAIGRALPEDRQYETANNVYTLYTPGYSSLDSAQASTVERRRTIMLSTYLVASIRPTILLASDIRSVLNSLIDWSLSESDTATREALLEQVSLVANKWLLPSDSEYLRDTATKLRRMLDPQAQLTDQGSTGNQIQSGNALHVLFWLCRAAILRLDPLSTPLLDHLVGLLSHTSCGAAAAREFSVLVAPHELFKTDNFVVVRQLYKQRLFAYCVPTLAKDFRSASTTRLSAAASGGGVGAESDKWSDIKANYLVALAGILRHTPTEVILPHLQTLLPLLLQSIDLPQPNVKFATLQVLTVTLTESPTSLEEHVSGLIKRLMQCATAGREGHATASNPPRVRISALACLRHFPTAFSKRHGLLLPHRPAVIRDLVAVLDDPKRDVRKEAVDCRAAWLRLDEPDD